MKKICLWAAFLFLGWSSNVFAHPPKLIEAEYSFEDKELILNVNHPVSNTRSHYIKKIMIDGQGINRERIFLRWQDNLEGFTKKIPMEVDIGETIRIKAFCEKRGIEKITFVIPDPSDTEEVLDQP